MSTIETSSVASADTIVAPASGQATGAPLPSTTTEGFAQFLDGFRKYESVLELMTKATSDAKFKQELLTIEQWFKVLTEPERNASVHSLLQHCAQDQLRFFQSLIATIIKPEEPKTVAVAQERPKLGKLAMRPPSLNIVELDSPVTPTPVTANESATGEKSHDNELAQALRQTAAGPEGSSSTTLSKDPNSTNPLPGFSGINPYTLNMLANAGLSKDAQLLAAQLVMSGIVQPTGLLQQPSVKAKKPLPSGNWRTPSSARFPTSALRSSGLRPGSGLKSAGLKSAGLKNYGLPPQTPMYKSSGLVPQTPVSAMESPRPEDFKPEMLDDIPGWLRGLRLHKYTSCFDGLPWQEMVVLDDAALEAKGVSALGARRRLLRTFEQVRKEMDMEEPNSATPTTSAIPAPNFAGEYPTAPQSAFPRSKLSINSPIFTPSWEVTKVPQSAAPAVDATPAVESTLAAAVTPEQAATTPIAVADSSAAE